MLDVQDVVQVERGIYASDRSPMGVGYRMIATSAGLAEDEKREIVRCAPSQGNLCDDAADASGLASFTLSSGRQAVLLSRHAGIEPTARGGYNVLTHVLVLEASVFAGFDYDPFSVADTAWDILEDQTPDSAVRRLDTLALAAPTAVAPAEADRTFAVRDSEPLVMALQAVLLGQKVVLTGAAEREQVLRCVVAATPAVRRQGMSVSFGMKYTRARQFDFVVTEATANEIRRIGGGVSMVAWGASAAAGAPGYGDWLGFVKDRCAAGDFGRVASLCREITAGGAEADLARVVRLVGELEHVHEADKPQLEVLSASYLGAASPVGMPGSLLAELQTKIATRREAIEQAEREAAEREAAERAAAERDAAEQAGAEAEPASAPITERR